MSFSSYLRLALQGTAARNANFYKVITNSRVQSRFNIWTEKYGGKCEQI